MRYLVQLSAWILLQSVWQTFTIALMLAVSERLLDRAPAGQRFRCAVLHLLTAISAVVLSAVSSQAGVSAGAAPRWTSGADKAWLSDGSDGSYRFSAALVSIWLTGTILVQLLLAVRLVRMMRFARRAAEAPVEVLSIVEDLSRQIGLARPPRVCQGRFRSPLVAGWRSSVVIVPDDFAAIHPGTEARALLAHELAHVVRCDFSHNIVHLVLAAFLWWHPGVWFICARIRHERECACDEFAVEISGSSAGLANGLVHLASLPVDGDAVLVGAHSQGLANRLSRMAEPPRGQASRCAPWIFACIFVLFMTLVSVASAASAHVEPLTRAFAASPFSPSTVFTIHAHDPAGIFLVRVLRGRVLGVVIGGEAIPANRVTQRGGTVTVTNADGRQLLRLEVDPRGGFRWTPRHPGAAS